MSTTYPHLQDISGESTFYRLQTQDLREEQQLFIFFTKELLRRDGNTHGWTRPTPDSGVD